MNWTIRPTTEVAVAPLKDAYRQRLSAPLDGMWDSGIIPRAAHWAIDVAGRLSGYFCLDSDARLLQFDLVDAARPLGPAIMAQLIESGQVWTALAGTNEPFFLTLCLDWQKGVAVHTYLYQDHRPVLPSLPTYDNPPLRPARPAEMERLVAFALANVGGPEKWLRRYIGRIVGRGELFVSETEGVIVGWGECRLSDTQPAYADLGMAVAKTYRRQGIATYVMAWLKQHCYGLGRQPICSTTVSNIGSRKALARAGFISEHRLLSIDFHEEDEGGEMD